MRETVNGSRSHKHVALSRGPAKKVGRELFSPCHFAPSLTFFISLNPLFPLFLYLDVSSSFDDNHDSPSLVLPAPSRSRLASPSRTRFLIQFNNYSASPSFFSPVSIFSSSPFQFATSRHLHLHPAVLLSPQRLLFRLRLPAHLRPLSC